MGQYVKPPKRDKNATILLTYCDLEKFHTIQVDFYSFRYLSK